VINFDVPWQPDDYIHRIGRTGRAGMKGIAITLAAREDGEAVSRIEKLIGGKIPRTGAPAEPTTKPEEVAVEQPAKPVRTRKPKTEKRMAEAPPAEPVETTAEPSPVVEDLKGEWNGPLPSFLSVSAG
jgi:superfamily II DNA/RNA helicase